MARLSEQLRALSRPPADARPYARERETMMHRDNSQFVRAIMMFSFFPIGVALTWLSTPDSARGWFALAIALIVAGNIAGNVVPWDRLPRAVEPSMPLLTVAASWLWAASAGGFGNGFAILAMPPLMWLAMYADPADLAAGIALLATLAIVPTHELFAGLPAPGSWQSTAVALLLISLVTGMVRPLVATLRRRNRELERATRSLRVAQAALAHDLRTPLTSAIALATMAGERIEEGTEPDLRAAREYALRIVDLGWRADSTIDGALELSKAGEVLPSSAPVDLEALLRDAVREAGDLDLTIGELPTDVVGHAPSLKRAFENVLRNAVDHAHPRAAHRTVHVHASGEETSTGWRVHLTDDGRGLPPADRQLLLEPWQRGPDALAGGSGLGLAIVSAIALQHGGSVALSDGPDGGVRVTIELARHARVRAARTGAHSRTLEPA